LHQILEPVISLYSNESIKFPNGQLMRQAIAFKCLDIMLLLSFRIGPEQTRTEMEFILKDYFNAFSLVRNAIFSSDTIKKQTLSKPLLIKSKCQANKTRASIVAFTTHRTNQNENSLDEFLKFSYDKSTNEIIGLSIKAIDEINDQSDTSVTVGSITYNKYRSQSIGLLSLNNDQGFFFLLKKTQIQFFSIKPVINR
jgi:hypothetical protein